MAKDICVTCKEGKAGAHECRTCHENVHGPIQGCSVSANDPENEMYVICKRCSKNKNRKNKNSKKDQKDQSIRNLLGPAKPSGTSKPSSSSSSSKGSSIGSSKSPATNPKSKSKPKTLPKSSSSSSSSRSKDSSEGSSKSVSALPTPTPPTPTPTSSSSSSSSSSKSLATNPKSTPKPTTLTKHFWNNPTCAKETRVWFGKLDNETCEAIAKFAANCDVPKEYRMDANWHKAFVKKFKPPYSDDESNHYQSRWVTAIGLRNFEEEKLVANIETTHRL